VPAKVVGETSSRLPTEGVAEASSYMQPLIFAPLSGRLMNIGVVTVNAHLSETSYTVSGDRAMVF